MDISYINEALKNGFNMSSKEVSFNYSKGLISVLFDRVMHTTNGLLTEI
jgi:hypothetical protein